MRVISFFDPRYLSKMYALRKIDSHEVLLIDPIVADVNFINVMEAAGLSVVAAAFTQARPGAIEGYRSMARIYGDFPVYAGIDTISGIRTINIKDSPETAIAGLTLLRHRIHEHRSSFLFYQVDNFLFPGSLLQAGSMDLEEHSGSEVQLLARIWKLLSSLNEHSLILPASGPPSTVAAELCSNRGFLEALRHMEKDSQLALLDNPSIAEIGEYLSRV